MHPTIPLLGAALILYYIFTTLRRFYTNYKSAKRSGLPLIISPIYGFGRIWLTTQELWMPLFERLPKSLTHPWIRVIEGDWVWKHGFTPYHDIGADTFIVVAPGQNILYTADAGVIAQITTRRTDFPKPIHQYKILEIYGKNVVSHEGPEWRRHRKITAPPFTEKNNHLVWTESLFQAQNMVTSWVGNSGKSKTISKISADAMRLSLHVISRAGFDVRCLWPGVNDDDEKAIQEGAMSTNVIPKGHAMSYVESLETLLHRIIVILLLPDWFAKHFPSKFLNTAHQSFTEWGKYMHEIYTRKSAALLSDLEKPPHSSSSTNMDLMGAMITNSGLIPGTPNHGDPTAGLTESEIMGNSFVFMLAGHETAANTIHHSILYLAMYPQYQRKLQADLDSIFGDRQISEWDYDRDIPALFAGWAGAVMNEELRLIPPVIHIPKSVAVEKDQVLNINGKEHVIAAGMPVALSAIGVHRNPKFWPHGLPRKNGPAIHATSNTDNDLEEFRPERWFATDAGSGAESATEKESTGTAETDDLAVNTAADTAASLFRPQKGAYIPFSEGYRACLGRRFAQVEILATLAVIYRDYSVELAVEADDEEVAEMSEKERKQTWLNERTKAEELLRTGMKSIITIQLRKGSVPLRVVRRGTERFRFEDQVIGG